jgi:hypothetical protein
VRMRRPIRLLCAGLLGVLAAVLVSCGSSGAGLIPAQNAGPLLGAFQAVERAAKEGNGRCTATEAAIRTTELDLQRLPAIDAGLRARLQEGVSKLRELALEMCAQPSSQATATGAASTTVKTPPPSSTTTETSTTSTGATQTTPPTATTPSSTQTSSTEGGTAPGVGASEGQAGEDGAAGGSGQGGAGAGAGEAPKSGDSSGGTGSGGTGTGGGSGGGGAGQ